MIRANHGGTLGNSKPCVKCLHDLVTKLPRKGYVLDTVYYTTRGNVLVSKKLTQLLEDDEPPHVTKFFCSVQ